MRCESRSVPSVAATSACVSPRVKSAEPWTRGKQPGADLDRPHRARVAAVDARLARKDLAANDLGFDVEQQVVDLDRIELGPGFGERALGRCVGVARRLRARLLGADLVGGADRFLGVRRDLGDERFVLGGRQPLPHGLAGVADKVVDRRDRDVALLVAKDDAAEHDLLAQLLRLGLDHQHRGLGAGDDQVHLRVGELCLGRVEHVLRR